MLQVTHWPHSNLPIVFLAPAFQGSGVPTLLSLSWHLPQTMSNSVTTFFVQRKESCETLRPIVYSAVWGQSGLLYASVKYTTYRSGFSLNGMSSSHTPQYIQTLFSYISCSRDHQYHSTITWSNFICIFLLQITPCDSHMKKSNSLESSLEEEEYGSLKPVRRTKQYDYKFNIQFVVSHRLGFLEIVALPKSRVIAIVFCILLWLRVELELVNLCSQVS